MRDWKKLIFHKNLKKQLKIPKVSICIPAYNQVVYLQKNIDSVLSQTYTDYEIIVTDDSPSDIVKDLIEQYQRPDIIKYYKNDTALGSPENWNESIRRSSGEYIKILHHDDYFNGENSLTKYVALLDNNPGADFAFSATRAIEPGIREWEHRISNRELEELKKDPLLLYRNNIIGAPSTTIYRRKIELFFDNNLKWLVDIEFYLRVMEQNSNIIYSTETLVVTCLAEGRVTDFCIDNKEVEVYEYLYVLNSIYAKKNKYPGKLVNNVLLKTIAVIDDYGIKNQQDIVSAGYTDKLPGKMKTYLALKSIGALPAKIYRKLLREF